MSTSITINGKTYASVDAMPAADRALWQQAQALLAQAEARGGGQASFQSSSQSVTIDGRTYGSQDDLPPQVRAKHQAALAAMDGLLGPAATPRVAPAPAVEPTRRPSDPVFVDERDLPHGKGGFVAGLLVGLVVAVGALAAAYFLAR
jgi:hypothetical protein